MNKIIAVLLLAVVISGKCISQVHPSTVKEYQKTYTTYPFSDPSPIPLLTEVYPYFRFDGFTTTATQKSWKVVELENDYLKLLILPEIGGKIWTAIEKSTNRPFLYDNKVIKFRDIAMRGPWTSGGLEANYGIIGHTPNCATPVDYYIEKKDDGSVSCFIGVLELLSRSYWRMEINLPADKAYFTTRSFWYNATPVEQPYFHWMNAGLKAAGDLEFIYPGNKYLGHEGEYAEWPVNKKGKKISFYEENNFGGYKSYHVFGKYSEFSGAYWHKDELGMVRYGARDNKAGSKIWIWGLSRQGMIWEKLLTDNDGQYVELQSGRMFNQNSPRSSYTPFKHISFAPYATDTWTEYWYPVLATKGMVKATDLGAMNLYVEDGWLKIRFSPVQEFSDTLKIMENDQLIYSKNIHLKTLQPFADSIQYNSSATAITASLKGHSFNYNSNPESEVLGRPTDAPVNFDYKSVYGSFVMGTEAMAQKNYPLAEENLTKSIRMDSNYLPALVQLSQLYYRNLRFREALALSKRALSINTHEGSANYYYGLINAALGNMVDAKDGFALATLTSEYRSAAYTELSRLFLKENNTTVAIQYAEKALVGNSYNMDALQLLALSYRLEGNKVTALETIKAIQALDPMNHFAVTETYLANPSQENKAAVSALIRNEMPAESYLERAIWYYNTGRSGDAVSTLLLSPKTPEVSYWLSFLGKQPVDFNAIDLSLSFPFRSETAIVIESLLKKQEHWKLKYQLALILHDRNRISESKELEKSCGMEPDYAPFYATRAAICKGDNDTETLADLRKAFSLDKNWRYPKLLTEFYNNHQQYALALPVIKTYYDSHPSDYIMGMLYAKTLLFNKKFSETDQVLSRLNIIPFEGATEGRELYREAKLMQAIEQMQKKQYKKALAFINASKQWPDNMGVGKPYDSEIDLRLENWLTYYCNSGLNRNAGNTALLDSIIQFTPRVDNTVRNFQPSNALVSAWAYKALNNPEKGSEWLENQVNSFPENKTIAWGRSVYEQKEITVLSVTEKDANLRILEAFMKL
jgi:tetratricopeptide (TPR) repeat protein